MRNDINLNKPLGVTKSAMELQVLIKFEKVGKIFEPIHETALRDASFEVFAGEFVCFIGPSGGGKSTILNIIAGLEKETSGNVQAPAGASMVFQSAALLPWLNIFDNVALGLRAKKFSKDRIYRDSMRFIEMMGLEEFVSKFPRELSGGQRQRVGVARALAVNPPVLLLDEPFSALDPQITEELHKDILRVWAETKHTIVMVSHSIEEAVALAEKVILMKNFAVDRIFPITLKRPRREQAEEFSRQVLEIRREFFK